jgi:hypothetical protein
MEAGSVLGGPLGPGWRYLPVKLISAARFSRHNLSVQASCQGRDSWAVPIPGIAAEIAAL